MILETVSTPVDIKALPKEQLNILAAEIRSELINVTSANGGHLASNLGVVELTIALHRVFDCPKDRIIFDVSHQSYVHKMLTGRRQYLKTIRKYGGLSGFQKRSESKADPFGTGHSSTSISAAAGFAAADKLAGRDNITVAVIGDGALTGGMAYEALNNCASYDNLIIILNDNGMSISPNVGATSRLLSRIRVSKRYFTFKRLTQKVFSAVPVIGTGLVDIARSLKDWGKRHLVHENLFEQMGMHYFGPLDGHDISAMEDVLREAKADGKCSVIHVCTKKGNGYAPAEKNPAFFHGVSPFDRESGEIKESGKTYSDVFGDTLARLASIDSRICAITAAMESGTGLGGFARAYPHRFFDVGIAEEHAMTFAAGLAAGGMKPVFAVYSTFSQRAYDQLIHDVALQNLPVVIALDRAGIVGSDGPTHHGMFDLAFLNSIPNLTVWSPYTETELKVCLKQALDLDSPAVVRYPRGRVPESKSVSDLDYAVTDFGQSEFIYNVLITTGSESAEAYRACEIAHANGVNVRLIRLIRVKPLPDITHLLKNARVIVTAEEGMKKGGLGESIAAMCAEKQLRARVTVCGAEDFLPHGDIGTLRTLAGIDSTTLAQKLCE
ncbi:MAG: 1-deoxy-D-xylulose-5-phosphate synthase [Clostridia bacterium]|nr:1-deoxy-D-xylulose-5-phosphate synthase [Clostridia bacterium]